MAENLYRVLLVDDEKYVRSWLRNCLDWGGHGFVLAGEAANGREALAQIEALGVHLVVSDMRMPEMPGTALMQRCRELYPEVLFLAVSGYDDFEYLRSAIQSEAVDYLLKPVKREELAAVLRDVRARLDKRERQKQAGQALQTENKRLHSAHSALRQLTGFAAGQPGTGLYCVALTPAGVYPAGGQATVATLPIRGQLAHVLACPTRAGLDAVCEELAALAPGRCALGGIKSTAADLPRAYLEASFALGEEAMRQGGVYRFAAEGAAAPLPAGLEPRLLAALHGKDKALLESALQQLDAALESVPRQQQRLALVQVCFLLLQGTPGSREALPALTLPRLEQLAQLCAQRDIEALRNQMDTLLQAARQTQTAGTPGGAAGRACAFIQSNFGRDISLEEIAAGAGVTPNYLCSLFKQEMGCSVFDYVSDIRIQRAKELLAVPEHKVQDICKQVGYSEPKYFSRVFRRLTGQTPSEYRQQVLQPGG